MKRAQLQYNGSVRVRVKPNEENTTQDFRKVAIDPF